MTPDHGFGVLQAPGPAVLEFLLSELQEYLLHTRLIMETHGQLFIMSAAAALIKTYRMLTTYTVWTDFGGTYVNRICAAYTSNGGVSWTGYQAISPVPSSGHHHQGCDICVGPGGVVYACWANCTTNGQNSTEDSIGLAKSTDGGVTWTGRNNCVDVNGIRAQYFYNNFRVAGFPRISIDKSG